MKTRYYPTSWLVRIFTLFLYPIGARIKDERLYIGMFQWTNIKDIVRVQRGFNDIHGDCTKIICKSKKPLRFNFSYMDGKTCRRMFYDLLKINRSIKFEFPLEKIASLKPRFPRSPGKEWYKYFEMNSDEIIKYEYPTLYFASIIIICVILIGPIAAFFFYTPQIVGYINVISGIIGFIGSLMFSIGLVNIFAGFYGQYLGHLFAKITLGGGSALIILLWLIMYSLK